MLKKSPSMASVPEIAQVLRELKESIEKQGTLLGTLISRLEPGGDAQEANQEIDQHTPHAAPESDDEHVGEATGSGATNSNGPRSFAESWVPLVEKWITWYHTNRSFPGGAYQNITGQHANTITDVSPQPRNAVANSRWRYCECHLRCLVCLYCLGT